MFKFFDAFARVVYPNCEHYTPIHYVTDKKITVRLVPRVGSEMALQEPRSGKRFPAQVTLVAQVVRQHMHRERRHTHVHLPAHAALLRALRVQRFVRLLVPRKIAARRVVFAAFAAPIFGPRSRGVQLEFEEFFLGAPVAGEKGLVGVGRGAAAVYFVDGAAATAAVAGRQEFRFCLKIEERRLTFLRSYVAAT